MTRSELKERLEAMLEDLPEDKAAMLVDFAAFLSQQSQSTESGEATSPENGWDAWEQGVIAAEEYWFSLPDATRRNYGHKTVAVVAGRVLEAGDDPTVLAARIQAGYPDRPVLYIEATADRLPALTIRGPRLR